MPIMPTTRSATSLLATIVAFLCLSGTAVAANDIAAGAELPELVRKLETIETITLTSMNRYKIYEDDESRKADGRPYQFAIAHAYSITPDSDGTWEEADGVKVWRLRITSPDALNLNLGFTDYFMPKGGTMVLSVPSTGFSIRPFTADDNKDHRQLWTPLLPGRELSVEVTLPANVARDELSLLLSSINSGYRGFEDLPSDDGSRCSLQEGSCNRDVICPEGDDWRDEIPSVARISIGGTSLCTGVLVNNVLQDQTPYFLTAYHCGVTTRPGFSDPSTVVFYWNYERSMCGGSNDATLSHDQTGSTLVAEYADTDFTLLLLDDNPPADVTFSGWDNTGADATTAVAIHHPQGTPKRISFENDATTVTAYGGTTTGGGTTHIRVEDWDLGTTEGGSSGSPLYDQNKRIIGQLHGGAAACSNDLPDWYGRLSVSWTGGGSADSRLSDWLDPDATGATTLDTLNPFTLSSVPSEVPSTVPSTVPSNVPSGPPSTESAVPSAIPSYVPSAGPSESARPSNVPSLSPSVLPSALPSAMPSVVPSSLPSVVPSALPSAIPSAGPSESANPSSGPSGLPSVVPSALPSAIPSLIPSALPSAIPSALPSVIPSSVPSDSAQPSTLPSGVPSTLPSFTAIPNNLCESPKVTCPISKGGRGGRELRTGSIGKGSGTTTTTPDEPKFPICVVKERTGRQTGIFYSTECIDLDDYLELQDGPTPAPAKGRMGGKGNAVVDFACGCCEAALEGDVPQFCAGPPVCEGEQTICDAEDRRDLRTQGGKGRGKPSDSTLICVGGTTTLCVDEYDPTYVGAAATYTCGACP
jgi:hypothetical protein